MVKKCFFIANKIKRQRYNFFNYDYDYNNDFVNRKIFLFSRWKFFYLEQV